MPPRQLLTEVLGGEEEETRQLREEQETWQLREEEEETMHPRPELLLQEVLQEVLQEGILRWAPLVALICSGIYMRVGI